MTLKVYIGGSRKLTEITGEGAGTMEDPLFIKNQEFPKGIVIENSTKYIILKDCIVDKFSLSLKKSQNLTIQGGKYNNIIITGSSNIIITDSLIIKQLSLEKCQNTVFEGCTIDKIRVFRSARPIVNNCTIKNWTTRAY